MPAMVFWTGEVSSYFEDPDNWTTDETGQPHRLPHAGDDVYFSAYGGSTEGRPSQGGPNGPEGGEGPLGPLPENHVDCVGFYGGQYKSVTVDVTYQATVYLADAVSTGVLNLDGGAISQPASGTDITVSPFGSFPAAFNWQGGVLNSSTHLAVLHLIGNTMGTISPGVLGTVSLGSTISLENGAKLLQGAGTVSVINDGVEIDINANCGMEADPGQDNKASYEKGGTVTFGAVMKIQGADSYFTVLSGTFETSGKIQNSGKVTLRSLTTLACSDPGTAYSQTAGATVLHGGSGLIALENMEISGGKLLTVDADRWNALCRITAQELKITGGKIAINHDPDEPLGVHTFGVLRCNANVTWTGGSFHPLVPYDVDEGAADKWYASGTFTIGGTASLVPVAIVTSNPPIPTDPVVGFRWLVLEGGRFPNNNAPAIDVNSWALVAESGASKGWYVKAK